MFASTVLQAMNGDISCQRLMQWWAWWKDDSWAWWSHSHPGFTSCNLDNLRLHGNRCIWQIQHGDLYQTRKIGLLQRNGLMRSQHSQRGPTTNSWVPSTRCLASSVGCHYPMAPCRILTLSNCTSELNWLLGWCYWLDHLLICVMRLRNRYTSTAR